MMVMVFTGCFGVRVYKLVSFDSVHCSIGAFKSIHTCMLRYVLCTSTNVVSLCSQLVNSGSL